MGAGRTNFNSPSCRLRRCDHSRSSAVLDLDRSERARLVRQGCARRMVPPNYRHNSSPPLTLTLSPSALKSAAGRGDGRHALRQHRQSPSGRRGSVVALGFMPKINEISRRTYKEHRTPKKEGAPAIHMVGQTQFPISLLIYKRQQKSKMPKARSSTTSTPRRFRRRP
jgi:hypothetical protein